MCTCITSGLEPPPEAIASKVRMARARFQDALGLESRGERDRALAIALAECEKAGRLDHAPLYAEALICVARVTESQQTAAACREAEDRYYEALEIAEAAACDVLVAETRHRLALIALRMHTGLKRAREHVARLADTVARLAPCPCWEAKLHHVRGELYDREGDYAGAVAEKKLAIEAVAELVEHQPARARYQQSYRKSLLSQGSLAGADHQAALQTGDAAVTALRSHHSEIIELETNVALALETHAISRRTARTRLQAALHRIPRKYRSACLDAGVLHTFLSDVRYGEGNAPAALRHARKALQIYERIGAPAHRRAEACTSIGNAEFKRRRFAEALKRYETALRLRRLLPASHFQVVVNRVSIAETLFELARSGPGRARGQGPLVEARAILASDSVRRCPDHRGIQRWIAEVRRKVDDVLGPSPDDGPESEPPPTPPPPSRPPVSQLQL